MKPSISNAFIKQFLTESKKEIRREIMNQKADDSASISSGIDTTSPRMCRNRLFSCWQILLGRRFSSCVPEENDIE